MASTRFSYAERLARHRLARKLRRQGLSFQAIGERLGVTASTAFKLVTEPPSELMRADPTIVSMRRAGKSTAEIAAATGLGRRAVHFAYRRLGLPVPPPRPRMVKVRKPRRRIAWLAKAQQLRKAGATLKMIAAVVGVSVQRVQYVLSRRPS